MNAVRYNADNVKASARGRWREILPMIGGFNPGDLTGRHGPCPACGGTDRFRALDDFNESGAVYCNQCFSERNGDGLAAIAWRTGWKFPEALRAVAEYLDINPSADGYPRIGSPAPMTSSSQNQTDGEELNGSLAESLQVEADSKALETLQKLAETFRLKFTATRESDNSTAKRLNENGLQRFAEHTPPIRAEDISRFGTLHGIYLPGTSWSLECIGVPGFLRSDDAGPTGWILRRVDGKEFSAYGNCKASKTRLIRGSKDCWSFPGGWEAMSASSVVWLCEGFPDAAALLPHLPDGHISATNLCGAESVPKDCRLFGGKTVYIVPDTDNVGIDGANKKASRFQQFAKLVKVIHLPFERGEKTTCVNQGGKDLRDWLNAGGLPSELLDLAKSTPEFAKPKKKTKEGQNRGRMTEVPQNRPAFDPFLNVFEPQGRTDTANSRRLIRKYGSQVLYCHA